MNERQIVISEPNARVLRALLRSRAVTHRDQEHVQDLSEELDRAVVLEPDRISSAVVTMYAVVRIRDLESGKRQELSLVTPAEADVRTNRISVLAPLGTALLGYRQGDEVECVMPGGVRRFLVEEVLQVTDTAEVAALT